MVFIALTFLFCISVYNTPVETSELVVNNGLKVEKSYAINSDGHWELLIKIETTDSYGGHLWIDKLKYMVEGSGLK